MNKYKVFINGSAGTTGLRIHQRLAQREDVELIEIDEAYRKDPEAIRACMAASDVSFFCLPDAAAREAAVMAAEAGCRVIDCSTAHRTNPAWAYGFPELSEKHRGAIISAPRVAGPGCHAGGFISLVYPLVQAGILPKDYPLSCTSVTGYSGGGKSMIADYEAADRSPLLGAPRQYGLGQSHKHLPEMEKVCGLERKPVFLPIVANFYAGMHVTVPLHTALLPGKPSLEKILETLSAHYSKGGHVHVMPEVANEGMLSAVTMAGRDDLRIYVSGNDERVLVHALFDNLGKGASGAALQCFNIMLGVPEGTGLEV